jgi:hypothetical protein
MKDRPTRLNRLSFVDDGPTRERRAVARQRDARAHPGSRMAHETRSVVSRGGWETARVSQSPASARRPRPSSRCAERSFAPRDESSERGTVDGLRTAPASARTEVAPISMEAPPISTTVASISQNDEPCRQSVAVVRETVAVMSEQGEEIRQTATPSRQTVTLSHENVARFHQNVEK